MRHGLSNMSVRGFLVTGPDGELDAFHLRVFLTLNPIDRRGQTVRYSCMPEDAERALQAAKDTDVTLQEIVVVGHKNAQGLDLGGGATATVSDCIEEYPVLHLGAHGMKWEKQEKPDAQ